MADTQRESTAPGLKILIVDDDPEVVEIFGTVVKEDDYCFSKLGRVLIAYDGNTAKATWEEERPKVVVLDVMLPKRSGFLVLERIRSVERGEHIEGETRVCMITAMEGKRHESYAEYLGVNDYLHKPVRMDRFLEILRGYISDIERGTPGKIQ